MKAQLQEIYNSSTSGSFEEFIQYTKPNWVCQMYNEETDTEEEIQLSLVIQTTDMYEATGEEEFKDYSIVPEICIINAKCHKSISQDGYDEFEGEYSDLQDVASYCGMLYKIEQFLSTDALNKKILDTLTIDKACLKSYECRFTGETKQYPVFKEHEDAQEFCKKLIEAYGDMHMTLVGFLLDQPVNLVGERGWKTIELCHKGIEKRKA